MRTEPRTPFVTFLLLCALLGCPTSGNKGFITLNPEKRLFQFTDGSLFVPVGHNDWCDLSLLTDPGRLDTYLAHMRANGENLLRVTPDGSEARVELRVGDFNPELVAGLDNLVASAEKHGIYLIIAFWQNQFTAPGGNWHTHPYNSNYDSRYGIVEEPEELFTNWWARRAIKNRIRFFVERWGASPNIFAWDLWNEINAFGTEEDQNRWIDEMGSFVKTIEEEAFAQHRLRTASTNNAGWGTSVSGIYTSENLDFTSYHTYDPSGRVDVNPFSGVRYFSSIIPVPFFLFTYQSALLALEKSTDRPVLGTEESGIVTDSDGLAWPFELWFQGYSTEQLDDIFTGCAWASYIAGSAGPSLRWVCSPLYGEGDDVSGYRALSTGMYEAQQALSSILSQLPLSDHASMVPAESGAVEAQYGGDFVSLALWDWPNFMLAWTVEDSEDFARTKRTPILAFRYLMDKDYRVTWYDLRTGQVLREDQAHGPSFQLRAPTFRTFVAAAVEAIR